MDVLQEIKLIPELNFILLCACTNPDKIIRDRIKKVADSPINWDLVCNISLSQRVLPLLYKNIKTIIPDKVPLRIIKKLKNDSFQNTTKNLYFFSLLLKILNLFKEHGIVAVPFKGPVMAQDIYGDITLRLFSDLDILVSKKKTLKAWKLLMDNGFNPELNLNSKQILRYINVEDNISFFNTDKSLNVELHWEMSGIYLTKPLMIEHVEKRLKKMLIEKRSILNLSSEDLLIYLCIHGAKHRWEYLEQICCISELLKKSNDLDWKFIEQSAAKWRCKNILYLGLYLSQILLDTPIPEPISAKIAAKKIIPILSQEVLKGMFKSHFHSTTECKSNRFLNFHIKIKDSFFDKVRYSFRLIFRPTKKEWFHYPVPANLSFLHFFLRPYRLVMATLRKQNA